MKQEEIKFPFTWDERHVLIKNRIWYVPEESPRGVQFTFSGWNSPDFFSNEYPIRVEYCSGNGTWVAAKAGEASHYNWIAVEKKFTRIKKIGAKVHNLNLPNLMPVWGEAYHVTKQYFPDKSIDEAYINFPDPWPKRRHAGNRLIQPRFLDELHRVLRPAGKISLTTDDPTYSQMAIKELLRHSGFVSCYSDPYFITELEGYGTSFFEELWRQQGKQIRYHCFEKR